MTNIVLCFDESGDTSATALFGLLERSDDQIAWRHCPPPSRRPGVALQTARDAIAAGYDFLCQTWKPGDEIFVLGAGRGGYDAQALARVLGTAGLLQPAWSDLVDFVIDSYALPRTHRTTQDWWRVRQLIADLSGGIDVAVPVTFLGLWDAVHSAELPAPPDSLPANVIRGRHAVAIDGGPLRHRVVAVPTDRVERVWFRGAHCDVVGGRGACDQLVGIAADWMLDGLLAAGVRVTAESRCAPTAPAQDDALAGSARNLSRRKPPLGAHVHASVEVYLRAHPEYWRRLPVRVLWADQEWLARGERLVAASTPAPIAAPIADAELVAAVS